MKNRNREDIDPHHYRYPQNEDWRRSSYSRNTKNYDPSNSNWYDYEDRPSRRDRSQWNDYENWRNEDRNYGLGDTSQGSANYGHPDNSRGSRYYGTGNYGGYFGSGYTPGRDYHPETHERNWWDRTTDEVASWFGDENAEKRRNLDRFEGPHKGKGPKGYKRSDQRIMEDINDQLFQNSHIDATNIEIDVKEGDVTLIGMVNDRRTKKMAENLVEKVPGVNDISNNLKIFKGYERNNSQNREDNESTMI